ncbi:MAG: hypothetical protein EU549_05105 [Promethearchaeota archaeon]|nr:MAG: hypothetical protein EU549_05105 [Candidatus Lokiarchaeota archaeon]
MTLKFSNNTLFLLGKIKYSNTPIFDLQKIEKNKFLREYLEKQLHIHSPPPYIKPPKKGTVLGNLKETIRFNDSNFISDIENEANHYIDHISFGFGERGYYYDINLNHDKIDVNKFEQIMIEFSKLIHKMEKNFETKLIELYYNVNYNKTSRKMFEISNFQATVEDDGSLERNFGLLNSILQIINRKSDIVVEEGNNFGLPEINIDIYNDYIFQSIDLFREKAKPLYDQRFFRVKKILSANRNDWVFSSRGIPLSSIIEIFSLFQ